MLILGYGVTGDWNDASNWSPNGGPPTSTDSATINGSATTTITVYLAEAADSLTLSDANAILNDEAPLAIGGTVTMSAGNVNIITETGVTVDGALNLEGDGALTIYGGQLNLNGTLSQTGGTLTLGRDPLEDIPNRRRFPFAPARRGDPARVQGAGDLAKGLRAGALSLTDSWRNHGAVRVRLSLMGGVGDGAGLG